MTDNERILTVVQSRISRQGLLGLEARIENRALAGDDSGMSEYRQHHTNVHYARHAVRDSFVGDCHAPAPPGYVVDCLQGASEGASW
jgi:hypothetical protein